MIAYLTITFDNPDELLRTARSIPQRDDVLWFVADGGSASFDEAFVQKLNGIREIDRHVSVADRGIYDAMNNALTLFVEWADNFEPDLSRVYVNFINSGDEVHPEFSVDAFDEFVGADDYPDLVAGHSERVLGEKSWLWRPKQSLRSMSWGMPFEHQAVFLRADHIHGRTFDTHYRIVGDYELLSRVVRDVPDIRYAIYPRRVCRFAVGGTSFSDRATAILEQGLVNVRVHGKPFPWVVMKIVYQYALHLAKKTIFWLWGARRG